MSGSVASDEQILSKNLPLSLEPSLSQRCVTFRGPRPLPACAASCGCFSTSSAAHVTLQVHQATSVSLDTASASPKRLEPSEVQE